MKYTEDHEWLRVDGDLVVVGITEHASEQLGDVVFVELPESETQVSKGDDICVIESVKAASDIVAPVDGEIVAVNDDLVDNPGLVNEDPTSIDRVIDEILRLEPPAPTNPRITTEDVEVCGQKIPAGSNVQLRVQCSDGAGPGDLIECGIDDVSICDQ